MRSLPASIVKSSLILGALSFAFGFFGPMLWSSSNLGPLLGILVGGPVGMLLGALWGLVRWATYADVADKGGVAGWIVGIWISTLLYTLFMIRLTPRAAFPAVVVQLLILMMSVFLVRRRDIRSRLPVTVQRAAPLALAVIAVILLMTVFPPVIAPSWGSPVAFILNSGFDASRHVPEFVVNVRVLLLAWVIVLFAGALGCYLVARRTPQI